MLAQISGITENDGADFRKPGEILGKFFTFIKYLILY